MHVISREVALVGLLACLVSAAIVATGHDSAAAGSLSLRAAAAPEVYEAATLGKTGLVVRGENTLSYVGVATALLGTVVVGSCGASAVPALAPVAIPTCAVSVGIAAFGFVIFSIAAFVSAVSGRSVAPAGAPYVAELEGGVIKSYYQHDGHRSVLAQLRSDYHAVGDGLPIPVGHTDCVNFDQDCQRLWYSTKPRSGAAGRAGHHISKVHVTPAHFDYRSNHSALLAAPVLKGKPTPVIKARQGPPATSVTEDVQPTSGGVAEYYGGYAWADYDDASATAAAGDADNNSDDQYGAATIINAMSDAANAGTQSFQYEGAYCIDITGSGDSEAATGGFFYIYDSLSEEPSDSSQESFLGTCEEEVS